MPRFQLGQSGNTKGRPRLADLSLTDVLRRKANAPRNKSKLADQLIALATRGKTEGVRLKAIGMLLDQLDGRRHVEDWLSAMVQAGPTVPSVRFRGIVQGLCAPAAHT
jgi:hypothetical protein